MVPYSVGKMDTKVRTSCIYQVMVDLDPRPVFKYSLEAVFGLLNRLGHRIGFVCVA